MGESDKRNYKRLPIKIDLLYRKVDSPTKESHAGSTVNVCPGGLYFETTADVFKLGGLLKVELSIPPTSGLLEFGGRMSGVGRILRVHYISVSRKDTEQPSLRSGVALEFCQPLKLSL